MTAAKKVAQKAYHHGNLRSELILASLQLIQEKGVRALTLREIGNVVGVSRMAPYRHFKDKADLLAAIREAGLDKFASALEAARTAAPTGFVARMNSMAVAYVRFAMEFQPYFEVMFGNTLRQGDSLPHESPAGERAFRILVETILEGQAAGEVREEDPVLLARAVWSLVHGISMLPHDTDMSPDGIGSQFVLFCAGTLHNGLLRDEASSARRSQVQSLQA